MTLSFSLKPDRLVSLSFLTLSFQSENDRLERLVSCELAVFTPE